MGESTWTDRWLVSLERDAAHARYSARWMHCTRDGATLSGRSGHTIALSTEDSTVLVLGGRAAAMVERVRTRYRSVERDVLAELEEAEPVEEGGQLWSSVEEPLSGDWPPRRVPPPNSAPPPPNDPTVARMLRHFPCHGSSGRAHALGVFYENLAPEFAQASIMPDMQHHFCPLAPARTCATSTISPQVPAPPENSTPALACRPCVLHA